MRRHRQKQQQQQQQQNSHNNNNHHSLCSLEDDILLPIQRRYKRKRRRPSYECKNNNYWILSSSSSTSTARRFTLSIISLMLVSNGVNNHNNNSNIFVWGEEESGFDQKNIPEKGDKDCLSLAERYESFIAGTADPSIWFSPCENEIRSTDIDTSTTTIDENIPENGIVVQVFSSLPAYGSDFGTIMTWLIVGYLDEASAWEYKISLNSTIDFTSTIVNSDGDNSNNNDNNEVLSITKAHLVWQYTSTENIKKLEASWWWRYQFIFYCYWGDDNNKYMNNNKTIGDAIVDPITLQQIKWDLNDYIRNGLQIWVQDEDTAAFEFYKYSYGIIGISIEDPRTSITPFMDGPQTIPPTFAPTVSPTTWHNVSHHDDDDDDDEEDEDIYEEPTYTLPVDPKMWDWQRYVGLIIFVLTFVGTFILIQLAMYRERQRQRRMIWGNYLGTEEGVDAILQTGWKIVNGSKIQVFEQSKRQKGYRDDDSLLMGGYEQRHNYNNTHHHSQHNNNNNVHHHTNTTTTGTHNDATTAEIITVTHDSVTTPDHTIIHQHQQQYSP